MKKYSEKLKDPRWQKKRLEVFERDNFCCQGCCDTESTLSVHHLRYIPNREPWDYPNDLLLTLCENCHNIEFEGMKDAVDSLIEQIKDRAFLSGSICDLAEAFNGLIMRFPPEVMASIIKWAFTNAEMIDSIGVKYFEYLKEKNKELKYKKDVSGS